MKLSLKRHSFILSFQLFFLISDLVFNCTSIFFNEGKSLTFFYFLQDSFLLLLLASIIYSCYSTTCYQVGLTDIIHRNFRIPVFVILCYISISLSLHLVTMYYLRNGESPKVATALLVIQKILCPINFYFSKRSVLIISDPRYYEN
ncbi:unnamed protein product [Chironomus riparius]|uniref:Transmembrane protein 138 n=1 Tax=Chironomus riparius TaxID=315576 RepID=A0A9N9RLP0_9DIPT|nr:unnamed protein product [Chironomus riparius]